MIDAAKAKELTKSTGLNVAIAMAGLEAEITKVAEAGKTSYLCINGMLCTSIETGLSPRATPLMENAKTKLEALGYHVTFEEYTPPPSSGLGYCLQPIKYCMRISWN